MNLWRAKPVEINFIEICVLRVELLQKITSIWGSILFKYFYNANKIVKIESGLFSASD